MSDFGLQLKALREAKGLTQEQLGEVVGKKKMTISLIESGKNDPPQGVFLEKLISALCPIREDETKLRDFAALARGTIPSDLLDYFCNIEEIRAALRRAKAQGRTSADWKTVFGGEKNEY